MEQVEKNLFRKRHSLTNENLKLSDGWLMMDASKQNLRSVNSTDKLAVKSTASIDSTEFVDSTSICISNLPESMVTASLKPIWKKLVQLEKSLWNAIPKLACVMVLHTLHSIIAKMLLEPYNCWTDTNTIIWFWRLNGPKHKKNLA